MKTDVFGARLTGIHKIKEEESHQFFFSYKIRWNCLGSDFLQEEKKIYTWVELSFI